MTHTSNGARLTSVSGETLPLREVTLTSEAVGGIARTIVRQQFTNRYSIPLELVYQFPLPADGAISAYEIVAGQRRIVGRVERRDDARAEYDAARLSGRTASLVEQERANLFTQHLGNIPASTDVTVELTVDHQLAWLPGNGWEWRFPTVVAPRYLGQEGVVTDGKVVTVDVTTDPLPVPACVTLAILDEEHEPATSTTHPIALSDSRAIIVENADLDRDIVIRWAVPTPTPGVSMRVTAASTDGAGTSTAFGLLTIVPPTIPVPALPRDLVLLLDVSGSMNGRPLAHLKSVVTGVIGSLGNDDTLEMVAFSSGQVRYRPRPVHATDNERQAARTWVDSLTASGGTEMIAAIEGALRPIRTGAARQVIVVTDGLIGFEADALRAIRDSLPAQSRLHTVGVGSATNRAFLSPAARAGRGVEIVIDLDEPADRGVARILAATRQPVVSDVAIHGTALLQDSVRLRDLLDGAPVIATLRVRPDGGTLVVRGRTAAGPWEQDVSIQPLASRGSAAIRALWARETIEDLELGLACGGSRKDIDARIEALAIEHSIASRLTSWIAVAEAPGVDPREPVQVERIPQMLPFGMSAEGMGLLGASSTVTSASMWHSVEFGAALFPGARSMRAEFGPKSAKIGRPSIRAAEIDKLRADILAERQRLAEIYERSARARAEALARLEAELRGFTQLRDHLLGSLRELERIAETAHEAIRALREIEAERLDAMARLDAIEQRLEEARRIPSILGRLPFRLRGRVVQVQGRSTSTIEVVATHAFDWRPTGIATLGHRTVNLVEQGTTRPGTVAPGTLVRVELDVATGDLEAVGHVDIPCAGGPALIVELDALG